MIFYNVKWCNSIQDSLLFNKLILTYVLTNCEYISGRALNKITSCTQTITISLKYYFSAGTRKWYRVTPLYHFTMNLYFLGETFEFSNYLWSTHKEWRGQSPSLWVRVSQRISYRWGIVYLHYGSNLTYFVITDYVHTFN